MPMSLPLQQAFEVNSRSALREFPLLRSVFPAARVTRVAHVVFRFILLVAAVGFSAASWISVARIIGPV